MKTLLANKEQKIALGLILLAVATRLLPHPPNFAPITGIALFAAARFQGKYLAVLIPFLSLFLTDLLLGLSAITWFVYAGFGLILLLGFQTKKTRITTVLLSSVLFFVVSNLGVWVLHYPLTLEGLTACFTLAIPFFTNTLLGDLVYTGVLFFSFSSIKQYVLQPR
ncbi:MAG: hypothetical protein HN591_05540 [Flavobacteriales bacterium]|jgi:uncharacterized membrane protein|nr:hypothetical protein [Flavobacteriales bacterium]